MRPPMRNLENLSQPNSQTPTQGATEKGRHKVKNVENASWDKSADMLFITLCVDEVRKGNRPGSHLNSAGWDNVIEKFNLAANREYNRTQMKNHWDALKRKWKEWKTLLRNETGIGWDHEKQTILATDDWWARKIKETPEAAKYRDKGPLLVAEQELLFDDVIATGTRIWQPISGVLPPHMQEDDVFTEPIGSPTTNLGDSTPIEVDNEEDERINLRRKNPFPSIIQRKTKKVNTGETIAKSFANVVELIKNKQAAAVSHPVAPLYTIKECMEVLDKMNEIQEGDELWLFATDLFRDPCDREIFLSMKKNETRLIWLERQMVKDMRKKTSLYREGPENAENASS